MSDNTRNFCIGGISGIISRTFVAPLDKIKILMQVQNKSFIALYKNIIQTKGYSGLWKGNLMNCVRVFPYSALQFSTFDYLKKIDNTLEKELTIKKRLKYGLISGVVASSLTHPIDVIRHQIIFYKDIGMTKALQKLYIEGGYKNLFKGYGSTVFSLTPFIAINFCIYDHLKHNYIEKKTPQNIILLSSVSAIISQTICYPLDTIRRQMQLSNHGYKNGLDVLFKIVRYNGVTKLYSGIHLNVLKIIPNNCLRFLAYEMLKEVF